MKSNLKIISAFLVLVIGPYLLPNSASAAGRTNQSATNTVLNGKGAPTTKIGINGDFYIDVLTFNMYGPKVNNKWPAPTSLKGPAGVNGSEGKQGDKGSTGTGNSGAKGEIGDQGLQGEKGLQGDKGEKGDKGERGEKGETGAQGLTGLTGANGIQGATGATGSQGLRGETGLAGATGSQGLKGDTGLTGATGSQGLKGDTGLTGAKGDSGTNGVNGTNGSNGAKGDTGATGTTGATGATGATGPSNVYLLTVPSFTLSTSTPKTSSSSVSFGSPENGKSYKFEMTVKGSTAASTGRFGLTVTSSGVGDQLTFDYVVAYVDEIRSGTTWKGWQFHVIGSLIAGSGSSLTVSVTDGTGTTNSNPMSVTGTVLLTLVGSISNG